MASKSKNTEVDAYLFIRDDLKQRGWNTRSPERGGQVYTQNECLAHPEIKAGLGLDKPENVVKVTDSVFWVIEAKREHSKLPVAVHEAKEYAKKINRSQTIKAAFVSGVAGNEDESYLVETFFMVGDEFVPITMNGMAISSLISPDVARTVLGFGPDILDVPVDEKLFLAKAEKINKILHVGAINKNTRARVMAALLLSLADDASLNVDNAPSVLISEINAKALRVLKRDGKGEFGSFVELTLPPTEDNHIKYKTALVSTIQELNSINIRSAMNSGTDVLGKFYEVFLKYGNGAKEIGIVLTPRHITQFAVDVVGVTDRDIVYDPTCGTGGFLVAAFDRVKKDCSEADTNRFKATGLFGVEQEPEVVALAIVNMIFRGDGKLNITEGDCFQKQLLPHVSKENGRTARYAKTAPKDTERVVTRTLMNPPFSSPRKEFEFVEQALQQMAGGGYCSQLCHIRRWSSRAPTSFGARRACLPIIPC